MNNNSFDYVIAGAGIVGLTAAFEIKKREAGARILVLEKENKPGLHASGRNSGILHSGIYYSADTLKARICASGAKRMREFAAEQGIACEPCGKVIVATCEEDLPALDRLMKNAAENHIRAERLDEEEIRKIEPHARPFRSGIYTPETAVIESRAVIQKLFEILSRQGVAFRFNHKVQEIDPDKKEITVCHREERSDEAISEIASGSPSVGSPRNDKRRQTASTVFKFSYFVNAAGAHADKLAAWFGLGKEYAVLPFKGLYFKLRPERRHLVKSNIYPVPDLDIPFLGIHLTRVISGEVYVGPTAIPALGRENYGLWEGLDLQESVGILGRLLQMYIGNPHSFRQLVHREVLHYLKPYFLAAARRLVPELAADDLLPSEKIGIRPQLVRLSDKKLEMDFVIRQTDSSLHVLNAISPAFTSSFAFAGLIADRIQRKPEPAVEIRGGVV